MYITLKENYEKPVFFPNVSVSRTCSGLATAQSTAVRQLKVVFTATGAVDHVEGPKVQLDRAGAGFRTPDLVLAA